jgi:hypothetical protein
MHTTKIWGMFLQKLSNHTYFCIVKNSGFVCSKTNELYARSASFTPVYSTNEVTIFSIDLSDVAPSIFCKFNNIRTHFQLLITYTCIDNQLWLSILVTSSQFTTRNNDLSIATLMVHNITWCIASAMVQPIKSL